MKKLLMKIASGVFALSLIFSAVFAGVNSVSTTGASAATKRQNVTGSVTGDYKDDVEWLEVYDTVDSATVSDDWKAESAMSIQTPDVIKYTFSERQALVTTNYYNPSGTNADGSTYNYAIVVEFDMMLNNVDAANFGFIYGAEAATPGYSATLDMQLNSANCLSFYGVNSMFYSTLENDSLIYDADGERPSSNRWLNWHRSAKTTLYIHPDGSQELYQNDKLIAYVTEKDIAAMDAAAAARGAIQAGQMIARSKKLNGYMGFAYRPNENSSLTMDLTLSSFRMGFINESWFSNMKGYEIVDGREQLVIANKVLPDNPFPTSPSNDYQSGNIWWRIKDIEAPEGGGMGKSGETTTWFKFHDKLSNDISNTQIGWIKAEKNDYGYYMAGATALETKLELPNADARLWGQRYAMLRMRTWLGGLNAGVFSITMGEYKITINQATLDEQTYYYMRLYDGDKLLTDIETGLQYKRIKIRDNAQLQVSLWANKSISVSYGTDGNLGEFSMTAASSDTYGQTLSGQTRGPIRIETTSKNVRCFYDDLTVYTFEPYEGEDFTGGNYDSSRVQLDGQYATIDSVAGLVDFNTPGTDESAAILSPNKYTNFTLEFDSPYRSTERNASGGIVKNSWLGIVMGMDECSADHYGDYNLPTGNYRGNNNLFLLINNQGAVHLWTGASDQMGYISDGEGGILRYAPMLIPKDENNDNKWPAAKPWHTLAEVNTYDEIGCADQNIHFKIIVQDNVLTMYHQIGDYEMVKTFESIVLGNDAFGNLKNSGYVSIQCTSNAGFAIDNVKITENSALGAVAYNTFLDSNGDLYEATVSRLSKSAAVADNVPASEILPVSHPEKAGYTFIGWVDATTGYLISESMTFANFGGRVFKPSYLGVYGNTLSTTGAIAINYYVELDEGAQKANYFIGEFTEEGKEPIEINTKDTNAVTKNTSKSGVSTVCFSINVAAKDYRKAIRFRIRVGSTYYSLTNAWEAYSIDKYLDQWKSESLTKGNEKSYEMGVSMEMYCEMARQYFDDSFSVPVAGEVINDVIVNYVDENDFNRLSAITGSDEDLQYYAIVPIANSDGMTGGAIPAGMKNWIRPMNFTVVFDSSTDLRFNFQYRDGNGWYLYDKNPDMNFYWGYENSTTNANNAIGCRGKGTNGTPYYYLQVSDIPASQLGGLHQFTIKYGNDFVTMQMSAIGYALGCIQDYEAAFAAGKATGEQAKLAWLGKAMYLYFQAALEYFAE